MEIFVMVLATLSPIAVLLTTFFIIKGFSKREGDVVRGLLYRETEARRFELQYKNREVSLPIRLQAYERMSLFCARIELGQVLLRLLPSCNTVRDLRIMLNMTIEDEFNHNITQQMYMSEELWNIILLAKLEAVNMVKQVAAPLADEQPAQAFVDAFVQRSQDAPQTGHLQAQTAIKKEVSLLF